MAGDPVFLDLQDTPMFKQRVDELEASAKRLRDRCNNLLNSAKKYRDALGTMLEAQQSFGAALQEFGGGTDDESLQIGSAIMSQFIKTFKELAEFYKQLMNQLSVQLIDRLQQDWMEGHLANLREEHKRFDKRCAEHESARVKHLALKKLSKREVVERSFGDLTVARQGADEARYELGRRLNEVESAKRYNFLEMVVLVVFSHMKFFEEGHCSLSRLTAATSNALEIVDHLRKEQTVRSATLEEMIRSHKEEAGIRDGMISQEATGADSNNSSNHMGISCFSGGNVNTNLNISSAGGPVQMSSQHAGLMADIERLIRGTQSTGGQQVTIIKQGYLSKKSQAKKGDWKRRFFVLDSLGMMYYYSHKGDNLMQQIGRSTRPKNTLPLLTSTVKMDAEDPALRFCFRVVSPEGTYTLQAESDYERSEWISALQGVINCLLNGSLDLSAMPRVPVRPTHSRHNSSTDPDGIIVHRSSGGGLTLTGSLLAAHGSSSPGLAPIDSSQEPSEPGSHEGSVSPISSSSPSLQNRRTPSGPLGPSPLSRETPVDVLSSGAVASTSTAAPSSGQASTQNGPAGSTSGAAMPTAGPQPPSRANSLQLPAGVGGPGSVAGSLCSTRTAGGAATPLERLRAVPGNYVCADCGSADPDWASLNLGILLCIECSGVHRQLGVHISKVRSCTLDVKVWDTIALEVFDSIGNAYSNSIWEANLPQVWPAAGGTTSPRAAAAANDSWVWCGDDGDEATEAAVLEVVAAEGSKKQQGGAYVQPRDHSTSSRYSSVDPSGSSATSSSKAGKPVAASPLPVKQRYITHKYVSKAWAGRMPQAQAQAQLWDAVEAHDLKLALQAIAAGADVNLAYRTPRAHRLVRDTSIKAATPPPGSPAAHAAAAASPAAAAEEASPRACGDVTVLHAAATIGYAPMFEFLMQNGASWQHVDVHRRNPLHYAVLYDRSVCAKLVLRRGGDPHRARDARGKTPMDMVMDKGRVDDEELFLLLSSM